MVTLKEKDAVGSWDAGRLWERPLQKDRGYAEWSSMLQQSWKMGR
jgi:hypothetical protein